MPTIKYQDHMIAMRDQENVLDALLRQGINAPFSCRNGICQACVQRCISGEIPADAQRGLRAELRDSGYFMPCKCVPLGDMAIAPPAALYATTVVHSKEMLSPFVCKILLEPTLNFVYHPGQFVNVRRQDGLTRSYSLASLPSEDYFLEIHVQRKNGGIMSNWLIDELKVGDILDIQGASGECFYKESAHNHNLLLVATGSGLAPLFGVVRDALHCEHKGEIHLYHGGREENRFYLRQTLRMLEQQHSNFHYHECISSNSTLIDGAHSGRAHEIAFAQHINLNGWQIYLAGMADMVDSGEQLALQCGAMPDSIYSDAFVLRDLRTKSREIKRPVTDLSTTEPIKYPPTDLELWVALRNGEMLMETLKDFYAQVFQDERLSSFFAGVTKQRSIEKQYLFMRQILTGEKIYFGDRPRNSHHWMVISDELFDYRRGIMTACLRKHGLPEDMIQRFHKLEEFFRSDIVKSAPFARIVGDIEVPFEGFGEMTMDVGTLCDSCEREVAVGEKVIYHVRLGKIYCSDCSSLHDRGIQNESVVSGN